MPPKIPPLTAGIRSTRQLRSSRRCRPVAAGVEALAQPFVKRGKQVASGSAAGKQDGCGFAHVRALRVAMEDEM